MSVTEKTYEMFWDCRYCGQRKNLGLSHRHCPGCGAPQDPAARYFPSDAEKVAVEDHPFVGADVECPACRFANSKASKCCANCGGPLAAGRSVALHLDPREAPAPAFVPSVQAVAQPAKKPTRWALFLVPLTILMTLFGGCLYVVFKTRPGELEVRGRTWERTIEVDRNELTRATAWCDSVPSGGRVLSRHRAERSSEKVPDGETCTTRRRDQGNGTFKEVKECTPKYKSKPVYDDQCDYETPQWHTVRTERAQGTIDAPRWPDVHLASAGACIGCEREGKRAESYVLKLHEAKTGDDGQCSLSEAAWSGFHVGDRCKAEVGAVLGNIDCGSLKKQ
jgi:hypothetical protein